MSWSIYGVALALSIVMFLLGIYVGQIVDSSSKTDISKDISALSQQMASVQLLLLADSTQNNASSATSFCPVYLSQLSAIDHQVEDVGYRLSYLEDVKHLYDNDLKKQYFLLEAQSYFLSKKVKTLCNENSVLLINFYSNSNCAKCNDQGAEILKARDELLDKKVKVKLFSFDGDLGSPVADALKNQYGVTSYPSIVINDSLYPGYYDKTQLEKLIAGSK